MTRKYIYGYFSLETLDCVYIGVETTSWGERHSNHMKPSKYDKQEINKWLQDNDGKWTMVKLYEIITDPNIADEMSKKHLHMIEIDLIKTYKPKYNKYGKESE